MDKRKREKNGKRSILVNLLMTILSLFELIHIYHALEFVMKLIDFLIILVWIVMPTFDIVCTY